MNIGNYKQLLTRPDALTAHSFPDLSIIYQPVNKTYFRAWALCAIVDQSQLLQKHHTGSYIRSCVLKLCPPQTHSATSCHTTYVTKHPDISYTYHMHSQHTGSQHPDISHRDHIHSRYSHIEYTCPPTHAEVYPECLSCLPVSSLTHC